MDSSKYVIIGAGLMGAATAWSLARRGHEVTVLERTEPAARDGSSHGSARIFRFAYVAQYWVDLVVRARAGFTELEELSGQQLITPTDSLDFGTMRTPAALAPMLATAGIEHELLTVKQARARWPQIAVDSDVLWHAGAGVLDAQSAVYTMLDLAKQHGAQLTTQWPVHGVEKTTTGYRVSAQDGRSIDAERIVIAAGGWLPELWDRLPLPSTFRTTLPRLHISQENAYHFPYRDPSVAWPTFIHKNPVIETYSLPGGRDADFRGQKIAEYNGGKRIGSASAQDGQIDPVNLDRMIAYVKLFLPGLVPEPYATTTCLFTNTPNQDLLIDSVDGIVLLSPCSGHGGKFAPVIGEIAADLATGTGTGPERFTAAAISASVSV